MPTGRKRAFDSRLEALETLRSAPASPSTSEQLRKALKDRNNYLVSKAAEIVGHAQLGSLIPDLIDAFDRFLVDPIKTDPQCWAKNAIAKALKNLEHQDPEIFLKGLSHFQLEPVWGGRSDTAATLRGTCALALIGCGINLLRLLTHLVDALADPEKPVRVDAARAIAQLSQPEGALLLRLKALIGDPEPEVVGECFTGLLSIATDAVSFVARFLERGDAEIRLEAAAALGSSREPEAIAILKGYWQRCGEVELKRAILTSLGASPLPEAAEFLLAVICEAPAPTAAEAIAALATSRYRSEMRARAAAVVEAREERSLQRVFQDEFGSSGASQNIGHGRGVHPVTAD